MRCVILDDYQDVARSYADWSVLPDVPRWTVLTEHVGDEDELVGILAGAAVLVVMRERTPVTRSRPRAAAGPAPRRHHRAAERVHRPRRRRRSWAWSCAAPRAARPRPAS